MSFTNIWDATAPLDSQLASQGAANARNLKVDVQQRMGAVCGTLANRPAIEAAFGQASLGFGYWASDEGKLYQWNGSAYVLAACSHIFSDVTKPATGAPVVETIVNQFTIPANYLATGMKLRAVAYGSNSVNPSSGTFKLYIGANSVSVGIANAISVAASLEGLMLGDATLMIFNARAMTPSSATDSLVGGTGPTYASSLLIKSTVIFTVGGGFTGYGLFCEVSF